MSIGITIATVMFCFYLYRYFEEKREAAEYDQFVNGLMNSGNHQEEDVKVERYVLTELEKCNVAETNK